MRTGALRRVLPYARPYVGRMIFAWSCGVADIAAGAAIPLITKAVIDGPLLRGDRAAALRLAAVALALGGAEAGLRFVRRNTFNVISLQMETELRNDLYAHLQSLPVSFHDSWRSGQLLSRAIYDIAAIRRFVGFGAVFALVSAVMFAVVLAMLFRLHTALALLTSVMIVPVLLLSRRFEMDYRSVARRVQDQQGDLTTTIEESATGIRIIKAFGRAPLMSSRFRAEAERLRTTAMTQVRLRAFFWTVLSLVPNLALAGVLFGGGLAVVNGSLTIGGLVAFISYLLMMVWPLEALGWILAMGEEALTAAQRLYEVLDVRPDIVDFPQARALESCEGRLRFENVSFRYPGSDGWVLREVTLDIAPGETLAIVGTTGCGKTTLASLVPRLIDVTEGRVTLDGHDVRDLTLRSLRRHVAVAFEDPILFSASARENVLLGRPDASEADVERALAIAQAEFVHELPWGLDTRVGEQGYTLSGGQRQRLALARAILEGPRVLVLDDPLSSVDVHTEAAVEEALARVLDGVTALLVVHRPSTLALADRVALLHEGTILAVGTHHELMETQPVYRAILSQEAEEIVA